MLRDFAGVLQNPWEVTSMDHVVVEFQNMWDIAIPGVQYVIEAQNSDPVFYLVSGHLNSSVLSFDVLD